MVLLELDALEIGERIRKVRKSTHLSQEKFAEIIDSSTQTVSNIETGRVIPTTQTMANIAHTCGVSIDKIVGLK